MVSNIEEIINDNRSGSLTFIKKALDLYRVILDNAKSRSDDLETVYKDLQNTSKILIKSKPNAVLLRKTGNNLLIYFKRLLKSDKTAPQILEGIEHKISLIEQELDKKVKKISYLGSRIIANSNKIMTISNSANVQKIFLTAKAQKRRFEVFTLKSHPPDEGIDLAEYLMDKSIKTTLISDAEMGVFMPDMNLVLIGADRLYEEGFINKTGSLPLCLTARHFNVPVYLAVETTKILSENERAIKLKHFSNEEIYTGENENISVENIYSEKVPLLLVHKVISEDGVFETHEFINWYLKE